MSEFGIGIEEHNGWAHLISVTLSGSEVVILDKRCVELIDPGLPSQPYHHETLKMDNEKAEKFLWNVKPSARKPALSSLKALTSEMAPTETCRVAIRTPPLEALPARVAKVHSDNNIMCHADGMIYHQALTAAAAQLNIKLFPFDKSQALEMAAQVMGLPTADLKAHLKAKRKMLKAPWPKGHRVACADAIAALGQEEPTS